LPDFDFEEDLSLPLSFGPQPAKTKLKANMPKAARKKPLPIIDSPFNDK
jgi:hypothetical protein